MKRRKDRNKLKSTYSVRQYTDFIKTFFRCFQNGVQFHSIRLSVILFIIKLQLSLSRFSRNSQMLKRFVCCFIPNFKGTGQWMWGVAAPWLRRLVAGLSSRRPGFDPGSVHVGFMVDKLALGQVSPQVLRFSPVNFIPLVLHYLEK
jgi:hypothetical protein